MISSRTQFLAVAPLFAALLGFPGLPGLPSSIAMAAQTEREVDTRGAAQYYEDALKKFREGKYRGAAIQLKNALQRNPSNLPARILYGRTLNKLRAGEEAEQQLRQARGAGADDSQTLVPLGEAYLSQGKFETLLREFPAGQRKPEIEAEVRVLRGQALLELRVLRQSEAEFRAALKLKPDFVKALVGLSSLRMSRGRLKEADELLDRAASLAPDNEIVWHIKGKLRLGQKDWQNALKYFNRALSLSEDLIGARVDRASVYLVTGRRDEALSELESIRRLEPRNTQAAILQALIFTQMGERQKALTLLDDVTSWIGVMSSEFLMKHPQSLLMMGAIQYSLKRYDDAIPYLQRYIELMPHVVSTRKMLGTIYLRRGDSPRALSMLEPALANAPDDLQLLTLLGMAYNKTRQYAKATEYFEKVASLAPENIMARTEIAVNMLAVGEVDAALGELKKAVDLAPGIGRAGALLGLLHLRRGDTESALEIADRLRKADPQNPFPLNLAGSAYVQARQFDKARQNFLAALVLKSDYWPAKYNLATVAGRLEGPDAAKKQYLAIIADDPAQIRAMTALASIARRSGDLDGAIEWLDRASKTDPTAVTPQLLLVNLLIQKGKLPDARQMVDSLQTRAPRNLAVLDAKARIQKANGNLADAIQTYRNAANSAAKSAPQLYRVARAQLALQDLQGAAFSLKAAVNLDPRMLRAQAALARLTYDLEGFAAAVEQVAALQEKFPGSAVADTVKGDVMMRNKLYGDAITAYRGAFAKAPTGTLALRIFRARRASGDKTAAVQDLASWVEANSKDYRARRTLALAYLETGDIDAAIRHHEFLAKQSARDVVIINNLAMLYSRRGDSRAYEFAKRAYELAPKQPQVIDTYGWMLVQKGDAEQGLTLLRNAQARASREPSIGYHIAVALEALDRPREALREMRAAIALGKEFDEAELARKLVRRLDQTN